MAENQPHHPQSTFPPGFAPPPPSVLASTPQYAYPQRQSLNPPPPAPIVIVMSQPNATTTGQDHVPDNRVISIISIFFCPILGIIATFLANRANNLKNQPEDLERAKRHAATAEKLAIDAMIIGCFLVIIVAILYYVFPFILGAIAFSNLFAMFAKLI